MTAEQQQSAAESARQIREHLQRYGAALKPEQRQRHEETARRMESLARGQEAAE